MKLNMQAGTETRKRIDLIGKLTSLGENTLMAAKYHLCDGANTKLAASVYDIKEPNLVRAIKKLNEVNEIVQLIKDNDLIITKQSEGKKCQ